MRHLTEFRQQKQSRFATDYDFVVLFTSTPGFQSDVRLAEMMKAAKPSLKIAFVGPHVTTKPEESLMASKAIDFVTHKEFDYTVTEFASGSPLEEIEGVSFRKDGKIVHTKQRLPIENLDALGDAYLQARHRRDPLQRALPSPSLHLVLHHAGLSC